MTPTNDPPPPSRLTTAIDIVSFTSVRGIFFGMGLMLYCMCVQLLIGDLKKSRRPRGQVAFSFSYCSLIVACALTSLITSTGTIVEAFTQDDDNTGVLLLAFPAAMQVRLLCFDDLITLTSFLA